MHFVYNRPRFGACDMSYKIGKESLMTPNRIAKE